MSTTKELWQQLVQHGQLCHSSVSKWHALAGSRREQLFREAQATPPLTYSPVSLENKNLLRSYHAQGLLPGFHPEDFADLNSDEADFLIRCAEENRWLTADSLSDHYCRTARDTAPASSEQLASIIKLPGRSFTPVLIENVTETVPLVGGTADLARRDEPQECCRCI